MDTYNVYREQSFSPEIKTEIFDLMTNAFMKNPMIGDYLFQGNWEHVHDFIELTVEYYIRCGEIIVCKNNESGKLAAVAAFGTPGLSPLSPTTIIKSGLLLKFIALVFKVGFPTVKRVLDYADTLAEGHLAEPHYYLYMLSSVERGAGRLVLNEAIERYTKDHIIFFESTVTKDDHAYYKSFGARPLGEVHIDGISNMFFVIDRSNEEPVFTERRKARSGSVADRRSN